MLLHSSPHQHVKRSVSQVMLWVSAALIPGILIQIHFFGAGIIIQCLIATLIALSSEFLVLALRKKPIRPTLQDGSAFLTALLIGVSIPPLAPWWISVIGTLFAIVIVKQLYGGLGFNLFNPAMAAYVLLLISFPLEMTSWLPPNTLAQHPVSLADSINLIFNGWSIAGYSVAQLSLGIDGISMATPLDTVKTQLAQNFTLSEILDANLFNSWAGEGWLWVNIAYLCGGLFLLKMKIIHWHIPASLITVLFVIALIFYSYDSDLYSSPAFHLFSGATMIGAFFIATDPVSASTTLKGKLIFGALIGFWVYVIRVWGGYPDGFAFAVIIANMTVPLIDYYTRTQPYGTR